MEVTWRNVALVDALSGALTPAGAALLEQEIADERLSVITLLGAPSSQRQRVELLAQLLQQAQSATSLVPSGSNSALTLLACVAHMEEDYRVLVLDANTVQGSPGWELVGAFCALSSLVVSCFGDADISTSGSALVPELPQPSRSLFQTLMREHATAEVHELLPNLLTIDLSSSRSLQERPLRSITQYGRGNENDESHALDSIVQLKRLGIVHPDTIIAETQQLEFFMPHAPVKKFFSVELTGEILLLLLQDFTRDVREGGEPDVGSAWDEVVESKCSAVADDALATYVDCIHSSARESPPIELEAFNKLHDEILRLAMDVYHSGAKAFKSSRKRSVRAKLKTAIRAKYEQELLVLHENSSRHCQEVRTATWTQLSGELEDDTDSTSFAAVLNTILRFDEQFSQQASGPEKAAVLRDFYRKEAIQVFQKLEAIVTRQMTEIHLKELRETLEGEFEAKKEALIAHFKQEETQLRACMAREIETMQKMHQARSSRVKIDENETKRVREELAQVNARNAELESHAVVLGQAQESAIVHRAALERKVDELELAVRHEMASRSELVDTLAGTIKSAEVRENALKLEVDELRHELGEKTFRVENELKELSLQLRKTSEVRFWFIWVENGWSGELDGIRPCILTCNMALTCVVYTRKRKSSRSS